MKLATPSRSWLARAALAVTLVAAPASAEPTFAIVPVECVQFWPAESWDELLSLAACSQDATVGQIRFEGEVDGLLEELDAALMPTLQIYYAAVRNGPAPIKLRAGFQMAMTQVSMITRARLSIVETARHRAPRDVLERKLEPTARHAWNMFVAIERAAINDPAYAPDTVTRHMLRMGRVYAAALDASWHFTRERPPILAEQRSAP